MIGKLIGFGIALAFVGCALNPPEDDMDGGVDGGATDGGAGSIGGHGGNAGSAGTAGGAGMSGHGGGIAGAGGNAGTGGAGSPPDAAVPPDSAVVHPDAAVVVPDGPVVHPDAPVVVPDAAPHADARPSDARASGGSGGSAGVGGSSGMSGAGGAGTGGNAGTGGAGMSGHGGGAGTGGTGGSAGVGGTGGSAGAAGMAGSSGAGGTGGTGGAGGAGGSGGTPGTCGNGALNTGEQCDMGASNGPDGDCSTTCQWNPPTIRAAISCAGGPSPGVCLGGGFDYPLIITTSRANRYSVEVMRVIGTGTAATVAPASGPITTSTTSLVFHTGSGNNDTMVVNITVSGRGGDVIYTLFRFQAKRTRPRPR